METPLMSDGEPRAFFSYSRDDSPFVTRLAADLKTAGISAWLDTRDIPPGREWDRAIEAALAKIPRMILILSPSSAASRNVRDEISFAIDSGKEIFPVLYRTCELPLQVRRLQYVDFRDDYEAGRAALIAKLTGVSAPASASAVPARSRWPLFAAALSLLCIALLFSVLRPKPVFRQSANSPESTEAKSSSTAPGTPVVENQATPPNTAQLDAAARSDGSKASPSKAEPAVETQKPERVTTDPPAQSTTSPAAGNSLPAPKSSFRDSFRITLLRYISEAPSGFQALGAKEWVDWTPSVSLPGAPSCRGSGYPREPVIECVLYRTDSEVEAANKFEDLIELTRATLPEWEGSRMNMFVAYFSSKKATSLVGLEVTKSGDHFDLVLSVRPK
jgi:hypothetical protein